MMRVPELQSHKNSLFTAMNRFICAVNNMDETVMVPSLLRDVLRDVPHASAAEPGEYLRAAEADMYTHYTQLKSIRNEIEWGAVLRAEEQQRAAEKASEPGMSEQAELEHLLRFHLKGLYGVLTKLTSHANQLTDRYKEEIGIAGWGQ